MCFRHLILTLQSLNYFNALVEILGYKPFSVPAFLFYLTEYKPEGYVDFRIEAPDAQNVQVSPDCRDGTNTHVFYNFTGDEILINGWIPNLFF